MDKDLQDMKKEFLMDVVLSNVRSASFQHGHVYSHGAATEEEAAFLKDFHARLRKLEERNSRAATDRVTDDEHIETIRVFAEELSQSHASVLAKGRLRIGTAQKAVNLFLKFLWILNFIPEPPHCPIDGIVIVETKGNEKWTEFDSLEIYRGILARIRECAGQQTLARWELDLWSRKA